MLEDFGQEVDLINPEDGKRSSLYFFTRFKYVPLSKFRFHHSFCLASSSSSS